MELLVVKLGILAEVHIVVADLKHGTLVACLVFKIPHCKGFEVLCRETSLVKLTLLAYRNCEADIALLAAVNKRRIYRGV